MTIIKMAKTRNAIKNYVASYYLTSKDNVYFDDDGGDVYIAGRKIKTQVATYKNLFVFAFVK